MRNSKSSSKFGDFLRGPFRRVSSGKSPTTKKSQGLSTSSNENSLKSNLKTEVSKERQGRGRDQQPQPNSTNVDVDMGGRSRSKSRGSSRSKSKSRDSWRSRSKSRGRSRSKSKSRNSLSNTPTSTNETSPRLSKSPSRARLEQVMDGIRARERSRSKSRDRRSNGDSSSVNNTSSARRRSKSREHQIERASKSPTGIRESVTYPLTPSDDDSYSLSSGWDANSVRTSLTTSGRDSSPTRSPSSSKAKGRHTVTDTTLTSTYPSPTKSKPRSSVPMAKKSKSCAVERSDDPAVWFSAINSCDWILVEDLLNSYDYKKYRKGDTLFVIECIRDLKSPVLHIRFEGSLLKIRVSPKNTGENTGIN